MAKDKKLQVALLVGLTAIFGVFVWKIPDYYSFFNLKLLKFGFIVFIILVVLSLILLALSQTTNKTNARKLEDGYNSLFKNSIHILIAITIIEISINFSFYITPIIKTLTDEGLSSIIMILTTILIFYILNRKGVKLFN